MTLTAELRQAAEDWIAGDPDPATRDELRALLDAGDAGPVRERVAGTLTFGTAGIRGVVGAGPLRMNRAVVIRTTRGLADDLLATHGVDAGPVVVGFDARLDSRRFATDTVAVLAAAGFEVRYFPDPSPTPLVAFAVLELGAVAGVVVTASHNPREYNGYKVYAADGVQIVPPRDERIAAAIDAVGPARQVPHAGDRLEAVAGAVPIGPDLFERYLDRLEAVRPDVPRDPDLRLVYTPLHGVGGTPVATALRRAGYRHVEVVAEQAEPDGRFPTVRFPNPEEPGALDLATNLALRTGADLVLANDPDVDRLAVALPEGGGFGLLSGNRIGALLGDFLLEHLPAEPTPLVVSSIVSSPLLGDIAAAYGARHEVTLTGFKWICTAALDLERDEGLRFAFGFEEALGYTVGTTVRDKDGIGAAVVFADLAAHCRSRGTTVQERLDELHRRHGLWVSHQHSVVRPGLQGQAEIAAAMARIGEDRAPTRLGGYEVAGVRDLRTGAEQRPRWLPATDLVELDLGGGSRALVRPSGTEPKLKLYVDLRGSGQPEHELADAARAVARDLVAFLGL